MEERRRSTRQNCRLYGRVHFNDGRKSKALPCTIRDISYEGARIELSDPVDIPDAIDLYIPQKHRILHASVRWRHGNRVGVAFSSVLLNLTTPPTGYAVLGGSISIVPP
jgi:PilZ domain